MSLVKLVSFALSLRSSLQISESIVLLHGIYFVRVPEFWFHEEIKAALRCDLLKAINIPSNSNKFEVSV